MPTPGPPKKPSRPQIVHPTPQIGGNPPEVGRPPKTGGHPPKTTERQIALEPEPVPVVEASGPVSGASKIQAFGQKRRHEEEWCRTPNTTGTGAIHVKTFHAKLTDDAMIYMDQVINEWLDAHPQYEVKFVTTTVGTVTGKLKEPHLVCQVWV